MAINRYTQPVQAQYIPTTPNAQLVTALLQKQAQEQAMASNALSTFESDLLKSKAYGDKDKATLAEKQKYYKGKLGELYDQYGSNPGLMLSAMRDINREYTQDVMAGDLARINQTYAQAQEDIKDAQERYSKGDLMPWAYRQQMDQAGTGFRAVQGSDYFDNAIDRYVSTSNWYNKVSGGDYNQALQTAWKGFLSDPEIQSQVQYMNDTEKAMLEQQFNSAFQSRWNAIKPKGKTTSSSGSAIPTGTKYFNFRNLGLEKNYENAEDFVNYKDFLDENGNIDQAKLKDHYGKMIDVANKPVDKLWDDDKTFWENMGNIFSPKESFNTVRSMHTREAMMSPTLSKKFVEDKIRERYKEFQDMRDLYNIPKNWSDEQAIDKINEIKGNYSSQFEATGFVRDDYVDILQDDIIQGDEMMNTMGREVRIKGSDKVYKNFDELADELGFKDVNELVKANKGMSKQGGLQSMGFKPGSFVYTLQDSNNNDIQIEVGPESNELEALFAPSWDIGNSIKTNDVGKGNLHEFTMGKAYTESYDEDTGERLGLFVSDGYEIIPDPETGEYEIYGLKKENGKLVPLLDEDGDRVPIDPMAQFGMAAEKYGERRIEKPDSNKYSYGNQQQ